MAELRAAIDRHIERQEVVVEDLIQRQYAIVVVARLALGEVAQHHAGHLVQGAGQAQRREHAIDPVDVFVDLLEEEDRAAELGRIGRADQRAQDRQVAAHQTASCLAAAQRAGAVLGRDDVVATLWRRVFQQRCLGFHHQGAEGRHAVAVPLRTGHRAVEGDEAGLALHAVDQRGEVGEAAEELRLGGNQLVVELVDDAVAARATGHRDDAGHRVVCKHRVDVAGALRIGAAELAVAGAQVRAMLDLESQRLQRLGGQLDGLALEGGIGRADQRDGVARAQAARQQRRGLGCRLSSGLGGNRQSRHASSGDSERLDKLATGRGHGFNS